MRTFGGVFVVLTGLVTACSPPVRADAGTGGGGGSLFTGGGGGATGGGATGGGAMGGAMGGGGATGGGGSDAGLPDAGPMEAFTFRIVNGSGAGVPNVGVRLESSPTQFVDAFSDFGGEVRLSFPGTMTRPLNLTLAKVNYGALSIIGITSEFPAQVRFEPLQPPAQNLQIQGTISGPSNGTRVIVDSFDFVTFTATVPLYGSTFDTASPHPLVVAALQLDLEGKLVNWSFTDGGTRSGARTVDLVLPMTPEPVTTAPWTGHFTRTGIFQSAPPSSIFVSGWKVVSQPTESWMVTGAGSKGFLDGGAGVGGELTTVPGVWAPNRMLVELTDVNSWLFRYRYRGDLSMPIDVTFPAVGSFSTGGADLASLSASASGAPDYDYFALTIEAPNSLSCAWRLYTATGAPFTIARLPDLPAGSRPSSVSVGAPSAMLFALPMVIKFEDPAMRPWLIQNSTGPLDAYRATFGGQYRTITGAWR